MRETPKFIGPEMLREIREHSDWRQVFTALGLQKTRGGNENDWWARSPFSEDRDPSFHMGEKGWYCWSTGDGGGVIELVQKVIGGRMGREMNCYEAGRWLLENGLSWVDDPGREKAAGGGAEGVGGGQAHAQRQTQVQVQAEARAGEGGRLRDGVGGGGSGVSRETGKTEKEEPAENRPIRQTLVPALDMEHEEFAHRGIGRKTCEYLECGYLPEENSKSHLRGRIVFQVRGVRWTRKEAGEFLEPVILTHTGRAMTKEEEENRGKWRAYEGFHTSLELYNIDKALLDEEALRQAGQTGHVLVVEGCYDVAKLVEADIRNVVATFGTHLSEGQLKRLDLIAEMTGTEEFLFWYDRDKAGVSGQEKALETVRRYGSEWFGARGFDWGVTFPSPVRGDVGIPEGIGDVCEFSVEQLGWLRKRGVI